MPPRFALSAIFLGALAVNVLNKTPPDAVPTVCPLLITALAAGKLEIFVAGNDDPPAGAALVIDDADDGANNVPLSLAAVDFALNWSAVNPLTGLAVVLSVAGAVLVLVAVACSFCLASRESSAAL